MTLHPRRTLPCVLLWPGRRLLKKQVCAVLSYSLSFVDMPIPQDTCSLDDLLTTYSIEGFFVHPADPFDLEGLLESDFYPLPPSEDTVESSLL